MLYDFLLLLIIFFAVYCYLLFSSNGFSRIAELEAHLQSTSAELDRKQRELNCFQREAEKLRATLEQFEKEQPQIASSQAAASHACDCMSVSCQVSMRYFHKPGRIVN